MGLAVGRQKAIVQASARSKVARTDGNQEFYLVLETISTSGHVIPPFIVWANKVHCIGFYATDSRPTIFSHLPSSYMDNDLGLDYIMKHFDKYIRWEIINSRMLIVDGHSSHIA
ncbi:hypothetical protein L211DRAFT_880083 [Terfezia boudieri ATCC MYA-4762]|uniref:DDE-1 domain-containing protein n=1 Tax=Terfezia boudieri ATCC MYA-4762 TaxID=1051890 RepID=A0A3N4LLD4_9PEZI|nr:hypothetical protein L211DRAFT_880083 [Terfezia boudieri ATCC MYA-4762]